MAFLELHNLTKTFSEITAVDGLSLSVDRGAIYVLLGPNGAGKTTTFRMIAGVTPASSGEIRVDGQSIEKNPTEVKSKFYYIPDRPYLYEKLTGREYLEFLINIYRRGDVDSLKGLLREFEISHRMDHLIESYSHGMRQKLLLAAAFMLNPPLLIVDEPLIGLDPKSAAILRRTLVDFVRDGRLVLVSTHQLALAEAIATRVGILHKGRLLAEGTHDHINELAAKENLEEAFLALTSDQDDF